MLVYILFCDLFVLILQAESHSSDAPKYESVEKLQKRSSRLWQCNEFSVKLRMPEA